MRRTLAALAAMAALLAPAAVAVALDLPGGQGSGSDARCSSGQNAAGATVNAGGDGRSG
ncbi:MAG: hypothetical protein JWN57_24, partial [Frankiales bacterium]|nr:hypothetical protein [Frankiales bacterium]